jgi:hypothetical protein
MALYHLLLNIAPDSLQINLKNALQSSLDEMSLKFKADIKETPA